VISFIKGRRETSLPSSKSSLPLNMARSSLSAWILGSA